MRRLYAWMALAGCAFWPGVLAAQETTRLGGELFRFGKEGIGPSQMQNAQAIAVDPQGFIYTGDSNLGRVQKFRPDGKLESLTYLEPAGIRSLAYERSGVVFVVAIYHLFRFDAATLTPLGEVPPVEGYNYLAVAPRPGGGVIVLMESRGVDDVAFIDRDGKIERTFHDVVSKVAQYMVQQPSIAMDSEGFFYVGDNGNNAIFKFSPDGRFINHFSSEGDAPGQFDTDIEALAIDGQDRLWVADWRGINLFAPDGRFLQRFDGFGVEGLAIRQDEIYMTDDSQVVKHAIGKP